VKELVGFLVCGQSLSFADARNTMPSRPWRYAFSVSVGSNISITAKNSLLGEDGTTCCVLVPG